MVMETYSLTEVSITAVAVIGACGSFLVILERSRCSVISLCYGFIKCDRNVPNVPDDSDDEDIESPIPPRIQRPT